MNIINILIFKCKIILCFIITKSNLNEINYEDLKSVIKNAVKQRLIKLDIVNIETLIETLLNQLMKKQSLITMDRV